MDSRMETNPRLQQRLRPFGIGCALFAFIVGLAEGMGPLFTLTTGFTAVHLTNEWMKHRRTTAGSPASHPPAV
ncbi:hypothetical protein Pan44_48510 [Caulifigura coniformis]|uniref:Uncharacterized protein n=1 Tax=Caulifigura coniformis TaxID=2527983 RepID=A0A517SKZ6_9PLAN|nr:hypothetical protein [Caulifigura coniformis]QDT56791.1 hypothetical protein Pan44_48510 [Caulifigura coniformis]